MNARMVPVSVRLSREDAAYIAALDIEGAVTMSEKIRHIVQDARQKSDPLRGAVEDVEKRLQKIRAAVDALDREGEQRSQFLCLMSDWLPRLLKELEASPQDLPALEARLGRRLQELLDQLARLGVTKGAPCHDPALVRRLLHPLVEILDLIRLNPSDKE